MSTTQRLDDWWGEEKGRWVNIDIDTTYGATCWTVEIGNVNEKAKVVACEVAFFDGDFKKVDDHGTIIHGVVVGDDWCGLDKTINAAIDKAEEVGL